MSLIAGIAALASAFACIALPLAAQSASDTPAIDPPTAKNAYVELGGNGIFYSLNYDRLLTPHVAARAGVMPFRAEDNASNGVAVVVAPVVGSYLFGEGNSHFEAGLGLGLATASIDDVGWDEDFGQTVYGTGVLGYRYQPKTGGIVFRAGLTPVFNAENFAPWVGVSVGYAF